MLRPGNRVHFVPSNRSMSPIIARRSYQFGCRSRRRRALQRCYHTLNAGAPAQTTYLRHGDSLGACS
jgi:hypothetical protein